VSPESSTKPDVTNLEASEQIIVEFAPQPIHRNGQDPGLPEHGRCASAAAAERAAALRSGDTRRSTAGGTGPRGDGFGAVDVGACDCGPLARQWLGSLAPLPSRQGARASASPTGRGTACFTAR